MEDADNSRARAQADAIVAAAQAEAAGILARAQAEAALVRLKAGRELQPAASTGERRSGAGASVLIVDDDELIRELVSEVLVEAGYGVVAAVNGADALQRMREAVPDLVVSDVNMPDMDGFELVARMREDSATRTVPLMFLTSRGGRDDVVHGLGLGADDYLAKPFDPNELLARVHTKVERPSLPRELLPFDRRTGALSAAAFVTAATREHERAVRNGRPAALAVLLVEEAPVVAERLGARAVAELERQLSATIGAALTPSDEVGRTAEGGFALLLVDRSLDVVDALLAELEAEIAGTTYYAGGQRLRVTPVVGWSVLGEPDSDAQRQQGRAAVAADAARAHLDLVPVRWSAALDAEFAAREAARDAARKERRRARLFERVRLPFQVALTFVLGLVVPFVAYWQLDRGGADITSFMYIVVVLALLVTGGSIWVEGFFALERRDPPDEPAVPYPPASAIIAAYLPNEAATVMETVEAFLDADYPFGLQVILAYNTPRDMPIEGLFKEVAAADSRFVPLRVEGSTSKAQNVNAALTMTTGDFIGVFDADHLPQRDSFRRAWRWLASGYDVVQGHPVVRNGDASWVARTVAVEFESIYAVSHPGRARLHDFGIFGGSNGYWKASLLSSIRMQGSMLTEDIDSALRVVESGGKIASDPYLVSRELAPTTMSALWNQRMRWAQGWWQVSKKHLWRGLRSRTLTPRQKYGYFFLLGWREIYPWLSVQMFPIVAYWIWRDGRDSLDWFIPVFVLTTLFTLSVGPGQVFFAYRLAVPEVRARRRWFLWYLLVASVFYTEWKNIIARVAQVKEAMGERAWKVTPRAGGDSPPSAPPA